jgi:hypothetical protein
MRERWAPFFDDGASTLLAHIRPTVSDTLSPVNAIIFLAPLTFDQYLEETPSVNRLKDTLLLWQQVCRNRLLANTTLILFLNKIDVLTRSLEEGVKVKKFISSYDKANDLKTVVTCAHSSPCIYLSYNNSTLSRFPKRIHRVSRMCCHLSVYSSVLIFLIQKKLSLSKRRIMYVHETSVVDAIMMRKILHTGAYCAHTALHLC